MTPHKPSLIQDHLLLSAASSTTQKNEKKVGEIHKLQPNKTNNEFLPNNPTFLNRLHEQQTGRIRSINQNKEKSTLSTIRGGKYIV